MLRHVLVPKDVAVGGAGVVLGEAHDGKDLAVVVALDALACRVIGRSDHGRGKHGETVIVA